MRIILMLPLAFIILTGLALLLKNIIQINLGEGFFLSVSLIIGVLYLSGRLLGTFSPGMFFLAAAGGAGFIFQVIVCLKAGKTAAMSLPVLAVFVIALLYGVVFFYGVFLQNPDDLHWYGPVALYMSQNNRLINWSEFIVPYQAYAPSFFELFFMKTAGNEEQVMYVSAFLLSWIGFLLPMSRMERKDWGKVLLYAAVIFAALYSLYGHPYKSLYVDLPCAAWAGGIAGWWAGRDQARGKKNAVILIAGLVTLAFFKQMVGVLMVLLILLYIVYEHEAQRCLTDADRGRRRCIRLTGGSFLVLMILVVVFSGGFLLLTRDRFFVMLPSSLQELLKATGFSGTKIIRLAGALGNSFLGTALHGKSDRSIYAFAFLCFLIIWQTADTWQESERASTVVRNAYVVFSGIGYIAALAAAYLTLFTYEEAVDAKSSKRYLSILIIYLFLICLSRWLQREEKDRQKNMMRLVGTLALLLFFITGWNDRFIANATAFNEYQVANSEDIIETRAEVSKIRKLIGQEDRVFLIDQEGENEMPLNVAFCYLQDQVSNFMTEPWQFTENGCVIRHAEKETPTVGDLPELLEDGGYTWLWVYNTDEYLANALQDVLKSDIPEEQMSDGQLFRVIYREGRFDGIELETCLDKEAPTLGETEGSESVSAE